jgi:hypothetical protein
VALTVLVWWGFVQQVFLGEPWGSNPTSDWILWLIWLILGIGFPLVFLIMRLVVDLGEDSLTIHYIPLAKRIVHLADIEKVAARTYRPLRELGGWGVRGSAHRRAYTVSGNQGTELTLHNGDVIMIGSQKASELALAIEAQLSR